MNREVKRRKVQRAKSTILLAGGVQAALSVWSMVSSAQARDLWGFVLFGVLALILAVFFCIFKHPFWGIAYTVLYLSGRILTLVAYVTIFNLVPHPAFGLGIVMGMILIVGVLALSIYADCQSVVLRKIIKSEED